MVSDTDAEAIAKIEAAIAEKQKELELARGEGRRKDADDIGTYIEYLKRKLYYHQDGPWQIDSPGEKEDIEEALNKRNARLKELTEFHRNYPEGMRKGELVKIIDEQEAKIRFLETKLAFKKGIITEGEYGKKVEALTTDGLRIKFTPEEYDILSAKYSKESERPASPAPMLPKIEKRTLVIGAAAFVLLMVIYFGGSWRSVPNGGQISGNYQLAREHYISGHQHYTEGDYSKAIVEYGTAADHFSKAAVLANQGAKRSSGNMREYLLLKETFYNSWAETTREMMYSSEAYLKKDPNEGITHSIRAEELAQASLKYNEEANELWKGLW